MLTSFRGQHSQVDLEDGQNNWTVSRKKWTHKSLQYSYLHGQSVSLFLRIKGLVTSIRFLYINLDSLPFKKDLAHLCQTIWPTDVQQRPQLLALLGHLDYTICIFPQAKSFLFILLCKAIASLLFVKADHVVSFCIWNCMSFFYCFFYCVWGIPHHHRCHSLGHEWFRKSILTHCNNFAVVEIRKQRTLLSPSCSSCTVSP